MQPVPSASAPGRWARLRREGFSPTAYTSVCVAALVLLSAIVVTGAAVRLTGSGLGCTDWPNCNDAKLVDVSSKHAAIEQVNRLFTFLVSVGVALAAAAVTYVSQKLGLDVAALGLNEAVLAGIIWAVIDIAVTKLPASVIRDYGTQLQKMLNAYSQGAQLKVDGFVGPVTVAQAQAEIRSR